MTASPTVALITGATSGIGRATARAIAASGATLYLVCRNAEKGTVLKHELATETGNVNVHLLVGDLSKQAEIHAVADAFLATGQPLHLLVNNAGVVNDRRVETADGIEETLAVNHLAYFLLTERLRETLIASAPARIVSVASNAHAFVKGVDFDDLEYRTRRYRTLAVYSQSKLCNILWTRELARQLKGTGVTANCVHPGAVGTGLASQNGGYARVVMAMLKPFFRSPEKGATASIHFALSPEVEGITGAYAVDRKVVTPKRWAQDDEVAQRLWAWSVKMTAGRIADA
jgi:retinol dehydrogenase 12